MALILDGLIVYTVRDLHDGLKISLATIRRKLQSGELKGRKVGSKWLIARPSVEDFLRGHSKPLPGFDSVDKETNLCDSDLETAKPIYSANGPRCPHCHGLLALLDR